MVGGRLQLLRGRKLRQVFTRRDHPRSVNFFSPPAGDVVYRGSWTRALETISVASGSIAALSLLQKKNEVTDSSAGGRNGVLANAPLAKTLLSLRPLSPLFREGLVIRESLLVPAGPPASTPVTKLPRFGQLSYKFW